MLNIRLPSVEHSLHLHLSIILISLYLRLSRVSAHHIASHAWITGVTSCREDTCGRRVLSLWCVVACIYGAFFPVRFFVLVLVRSCHILAVSFLCATVLSCPRPSIGIENIFYVCRRTQCYVCNLVIFICAHLDPILSFGFDETSKLTSLQPYIVQNNVLGVSSG